ncbi:hypothetical protein B0H16DRAFT_1458465 [Mycena metata]|uniref:Uncharacterized protein n=1 Tax=Mycena metata TaxID=1033252 RepID=A0AAD7J473_9AGAR|nr:hypothetical protein B0H16DRAFT_1458465 [Mycena metata]
MLWIPCVRVTRSGTEFSGLPNRVAILQEPAFDLAPLTARAIAREVRGRDGDHEDEEDDECGANDGDDQLITIDDNPDPLNTVDSEWPPPPPHDALNDVDDVERNPLKRRATFGEVVASAKRPHCHRAAKPDKAARKSAASNSCRKKKREAAFAQGGQKDKPSPSTARAYVNPAVPLVADLDASALPTTFGAYAAKAETKKEKYGSKVRRSLLDFVGMGFTVIHCDGLTPHPILDRHGRIIAVLAGQPDNVSYRAATFLAFEAIRNASNTARFPADMRKHRRGLFPAINIGLSYGKGQSTPCWLNNKEYTNLADNLLQNLSIQRMAAFADTSFALWVPRLYQYYKDHDEQLRTHHPLLRRPFKYSVFFCAAFNFGRNVWTFKHRDVLNVPFGWCGVQALGKYDHALGGHLVLSDLKLVVEFPHGALILLPSATIAHSNVPVQEHEERVSFTQFSAGGIFRYLDNGCKTVEGLATTDPEEYGRVMALMDARWERGIQLLSKIDELVTFEEL